MIIRISHIDLREKFKQFKINMTIKEKASRICRDNQYLLDEIEVKQIIEEWHSDVTILSNIIDSLQKILLEKHDTRLVTKKSRKV